jgi:hypothetical protein
MPMVEDSRIDTLPIETLKTRGRPILERMEEGLIFEGHLRGK